MDTKLSRAFLIVIALLAGAPQLQAAGPIIVAHGPVVSFTSSTGNLYWTSEFLNEHGRSSVGVLRGGKDNTPGSERRLYVISGSSVKTIPHLGQLVYANVAGEWFGYFASTTGGVSQIIRIPLAGGTATTIPASPVGAIRDLKTDGSHLYWADGAGIRRVDMTGGGAATIVNAAVSRLGLGASRVYFVRGNSIRSVAKSGGDMLLISATSSAVSDLYVHVAEKTTVFWAEENGSVRSRTGGDASSVVHQAPLSGRRASSVGYDGGRVLWIDCMAPGKSFCRLCSRRGTTTSTIVSVAGVGARNLAWDQTQVFWIDSGIKKFVY